MENKENESDFKEEIIIFDNHVVLRNQPKRLNAKISKKKKKTILGKISVPPENPIPKKSNAEFLVDTIVKTYWTTKWKEQLIIMKYSRTGFNRKRGDFRGLCMKLNHSMKYHQYLYLTKLFDNMEKLPMKQGIKHDDFYGKIKLITDNKKSEKIIEEKSNNGTEKFIIDDVKFEIKMDIPKLEEVEYKPEDEIKIENKNDNVISDKIEIEAESSKPKLMLHNKINKIRKKGKTILNKNKVNNAEEKNVTNNIEENNMNINIEKPNIISNKEDNNVIINIEEPKINSVKENNIINIEPNTINKEENNLNIDIEKQNSINIGENKTINNMEQINIINNKKENNIINKIEDKTINNDVENNIINIKEPNIINKKEDQNLINNKEEVNNINNKKNKTFLNNMNNIINTMIYTEKNKSQNMDKENNINKNNIEVKEDIDKDINPIKLEEKIENKNKEKEKENDLIQMQNEPKLGNDIKVDKDLIINNNEPKLGEIVEEKKENKEIAENIIPEIVINSINEDTRDKKDNNLSKKKVKRIEDNYIQMESLGVKRRSANLFVRTEKGLEIQEDEESSSFKKRKMSDFFNDYSEDRISKSKRLQYKLKKIKNNEV